MMAQGSGVRGQVPSLNVHLALKVEHRTSNIEHPKGFTLLEVMVALTILAIGFVIALELAGSTMRAVSTSEGYTSAVFLARQKMEELFLKPTLEKGVEEGTSVGYRWRREVIEREPEELQLGSGRPRARLLELRVRVSWPGRDRQRSLELVSLKAMVNP
ncbi:MAG: prepilin-type N-terminal cleavage/methylation domain-containing protein [candidate division NC10 bacterium]|nr:prepilin-type N-terminal cleavage/methylation domain-containing protein [candidate division NC10 bacterium]